MKGRVETEGKRIKRKHGSRAREIKKGRVKREGGDVGLQRAG